MVLSNYLAYKRSDTLLQVGGDIWISGALLRNYPAMRDSEKGKEEKTRFRFYRRFMLDASIIRLSLDLALGD